MIEIHGRPEENAIINKHLPLSKLHCKLRLDSMDLFPNLERDFFFTLKFYLALDLSYMAAKWKEKFSLINDVESVLKKIKHQAKKVHKLLTFFKIDFYELTFLTDTSKKIRRFSIRRNLLLIFIFMYVQ